MSFAMTMPRARCAPLPVRGEGWGEGVTALSRPVTPSPHPSPSGRGSRPSVCHRCCLHFAAALLTLLSLTNTSFAQTSVEDFYRGKQINLIVGYGPGGGYDITARLLARHIGRHIRGNPAIVVQNMPGAGSMRAINYLASVAPKDGLTFALFGSDMPMLALVGANTSVQFDPP